MENFESANNFKLGAFSTLPSVVVFSPFISFDWTTRNGFSGCFLFSIFPVSWRSSTNTSALSSSLLSLLAFLSGRRQILEYVGHFPRLESTHCIFKGLDRARTFLGSARCYDPEARGAENKKQTFQSDKSPRGGRGAKGHQKGIVSVTRFKARISPH